MSGRISWTSQNQYHSFWCKNQYHKIFFSNFGIWISVWTYLGLGGTPTYFPFQFTSPSMKYELNMKNGRRQGLEHEKEHIWNPNYMYILIQKKIRKKIFFMKTGWLYCIKGEERNKVQLHGGHWTNEVVVSLSNYLQDGQHSASLRHLLHQLEHLQLHFPRLSRCPTVTTKGV
jgi:hypothetical protein